MRKGANSCIKTVSDSLNLSQLRFHQIKDKEITKVLYCTISRLLILTGWALRHQTIDKNIFMHSTWADCTDKMKTDIVSYALLTWRIW